MSTFYKRVTKRKPPEREHTVRAQVGSSRELVVLHLLGRHYRRVLSFYFYSKDHVNWIQRLKLTVFFQESLLLSQFVFHVTHPEHVLQTSASRSRFFFSTTRDQPFLHALLQPAALCSRKDTKDTSLFEVIYNRGFSRNVFPDILQA